MAGGYYTIPCCTIPHQTIPYSTLLYSTPLHSTLLYSTLLYSTPLYCTVSFYTKLYCTAALPGFPKEPQTMAQYPKNREYRQYRVHYFSHLGGPGNSTGLESKTIHTGHGTLTILRTPKDFTDSKDPTDRQASYGTLTEPLGSYGNLRILRNPKDPTEPQGSYRTPRISWNPKDPTDFQGSYGTLRILRNSKDPKVSTAPPASKAWVGAPAGSLCRCPGGSSWQSNP